MIASKVDEYTTSSVEEGRFTFSRCNRKASIVDEETRNIQTNLSLDCVGCYAAVK